MSSGKKSFFFISIALFFCALVLFLLGPDKNEKINYRTAAITHGDLSVTINATGTVEPEEVIDVGAQVAGQILSFGKDVKGKTVDYGSEVGAGTVLARIDDSLYASDVEQAEAAFRSCAAILQKAKADLVRTEQDWKRARQLGPSEALSQSSYDSYESAWKIAQAQVAVNEADIQQKEAELKRARRNLEYCTITSPVKGVIIDRRVNTGQTVVASLDAPSLFLLAKDLTRIQVWVAVNEADIGKIHPGQTVTFTVDAFPGETFKGEVSKIRLNAIMTQNVVTYTVEIATDNSDGRLLPYLTANVQFHLQRFENVFQAPNAALRWKPTGRGVPGSMETPAKNETKTDDKKTSVQEQSKGKSGTVWVLDENRRPRPLHVQTGATDGVNTVIQGDNLREDLQFITGVKLITETAGSDSGGVSPFTPKFRGGPERR